MTSKKVKPAETVAFLANDSFAVEAELVADGSGQSLELILCSDGNQLNYFSLANSSELTDDDYELIEIWLAHHGAADLFAEVLKAIKGLLNID